MTTNQSHAPEPDKELVEIRGNANLYGLVTLAATAGAAAYAYRAVHGGEWHAWLVTVLLGGLAVVHAGGWWDARAPRLVADAQGVRLRRGRQWTGTPWDEVETVEVGRATGLRDGELRIRTAGREQALRFGVSARASRPDLPGTLRTLGAPVKAAPARPGAPRHAAALLPVQTVSSPVPPAPCLPGTGATPLADPARRAVRADVRREGPATVGMLALQPASAELPEEKELRGTSGRVGLVLENVAARVGSGAMPGTALDAAPVDPYPTQPAEQPVIGPDLAGARSRLRLSVDELAERTRIRPHVIESIEVDDFVPCGGDFYARGHIRALSRVVGVDPEPLVTRYDERYASGPIDARRVFAAELAGGPAPSLHMTRGGPNWAALLGVVMMLAILWGVAQLLTPDSENMRNPLPAPQAGASSEPASSSPERFAGIGTPSVNRVHLSASGGGSIVAVHDEAGAVVWRGRLDDGDARTVRIVGSATVTAADGGVVTASVNGQRRGLLGVPGQSVQRVLGSTPRR